MNKMHRITPAILYTFLSMDFAQSNEAHPTERVDGNIERHGSGIVSPILILTTRTIVLLIAVEVDIHVSAHSYKQKDQSPF
jgi:hypothetical protein